MINLDSILKSRDITLPTKVHLVKGMVFWVVMYGCESWTIKKAEGWRIDAFELWCWRRLLRVPWTARRSNQPNYQSWVFIGRTDVEAETPILWPPDMKNWLIGEDPEAGKNLRQEEKGTIEDEMVVWHHWLNGHELWVSSRSWWWTGKAGMLQSMGLQRVGQDWATELNWGGSDGKESTCNAGVQFRHSVVSDSLQPHGLQHARLPCPSPTPRACSNSCPLSWWCHPTISSSVIPFSSCLQSFPA